MGGRINGRIRSRRLRLKLSFAFLVGLAALVAGVVLVANIATRISSAATPSSGTLTIASGPLTYVSGPFATSNPTDQVNGVPTCDGTLPCDDYTLTVNVPAGHDVANYIRVQVSWPHQVTLAQYDIFVYKIVTPANNPPGPLMAANFFAVDPDVVTIPAISGTYLLRIAPTIAQGDTTTTKISLEQKVAAAPLGPGLAPRYQTYQAPGTLGNTAGEPSLGIGLATAQFPQGRTMYQANTTTLRVEFNDCPSPAATTWLNKTAPNTSSTTLDPILFSDRVTGRSFVSQLAGACSRAAFTDTAAPFNDGDTWVPSQGCGVPAGIDHQTFGGGPLAPPLTGNPSFPAYPNSLYYCSQYGTNAAACAISLNGGATFGPAVPIYQVSCFGIHGHVKVAPDGTVYVPNSDCSSSFNGPGPTDTSRQGLVFSEDNGATWSQPQLVPDSNPAPGIVDPSIGIGGNGTIYYGYANSNGAPSIAVGHKVNHQIVWGPSKDVGSASGIQNSTFPEVVAGDDDRAAFAFLGTTSSGYYQDPEDFQAIWHLYIATTYDGGATWITVDATPNDPVQLGSICNSGTVICDRLPNDRNLLDFMDATVDRVGRVQVAYPDGCVTAACIQATDRSGHTSGTPDGKINRYDNDNARKASIARQSGGRTLFAAFDPSEPAVPKAPNVVSATRDAGGSHLTFLQPDNGGAPITGYNILRGTSSGGETLLATINPAPTYDIVLLANKFVYDDASGDPNTTYFYRVTAVNSFGSGPFCSEFQLAGGTGTPTPTPTPTATPTPTPTPTTVQFSMASYSIPEAVTSVSITVTRTGTISGVSTVDYTVNNGAATQRGDFTYASGTVVFAANETSKTFPVLISEDGYLEGAENATITLTNPTGATLGSPSTAILQIGDNDLADAATNPNDDPATFVGQHYHDFLNRQADANGQTFWINQITSCGNDASCRDEKRTNVSAAFFLSVEFQNTGYFAFRFYRASFPDNAQRPRGVPRYLEFLRDEQKLQAHVVVGDPNWEAFLEQNKQGFALDWVDRADFIAEYPTTMTRDEYIDKLFTRSGATPTAQERNQALFAYDSGFSVKEKRAKGIRAVIDTGAVYNAQYNPAFVLMQYFGYLRRNPNNAPDNNFSGYDFWLNKMNQFSVAGEDVRDANVALARVKRAEMVKAFIVSGEYRGRFGVSGDGSRGQQFGPITEPPPEASWRNSLGAVAAALRLAFLPTFSRRVG
jgi:hypothetical protein